jgi:putative SOS response-associated peptidase YedK
MCGRFTLTASPHLVQEAFGLFDGLSPDLPPRNNVAPTQLVLTLRQTDTAAKPTYCSMRWGLIPSWADDMSIGHRLINARAEGIAEKPAFRSAFKRRRCLILADGFYEWQTGPKPAKGKAPKQPFHIHFPDRRPFAFAGLWETWSKGETPLDTCTVITTPANDMMKPLHDRMPVILDPADYARWLAPAPQDPNVHLELLRACPDDWLTRETVPDVINNARYEGPLGPAVRPE